MAASSESGSGVAACMSAIVTPPATKRGARTAIRRHSAGTRSRHKRAPIAIIRPATRSTGASGGATVPTAIPAATRIAHKSSLTGGLRSRSGLDRFACLDSGKGCYLLQGLGPDSRNLFELVHRGKLPVGLPVLDYALSRRRPDLGQLVELLDVRGIYVYPERILRLILYHFQGCGVDDPRNPFREARRVQCATGQYDHDQHRYDHLRPVTRERAGGRSPPRTRAARGRLESVVSHRKGYRDTRVEALGWFACQTAAFQHAPPF